MTLDFETLQKGVKNDEKSMIFEWDLWCAFGQKRWKNQCKFCNTIFHARDHQKVEIIDSQCRHFLCQKVWHLFFKIFVTFLKNWNFWVKFSLKTLMCTKCTFSASPGMRVPQTGFVNFSIFYENHKNFCNFFDFLIKMTKSFLPRMAYYFLKCDIF